MRRRQFDTPGPRASGPYQVDLLMQHGIDLDPVPPARGRLHKKVRDVVEHRSRIPWDLALRGLPRLRSAQAVLALLEDKALAPSAMKHLRIPGYRDRPLVVVSCWWAEELASGSNETRKRVTQALRNVDHVVCFSQNQKEIFVGAGLDPAQIHPVSFGVDPNWFKPENRALTGRPYVFAAGVDRGRDFETLVAAARSLPRVDFVVATQPGRITDPPANVKLLPPQPHDRYERLLQRAALVVVPTHDLAYPTGQSVLLEGMACGRPVAVTTTPAMQEYIDHGVSNYGIPLHDAAGTAEVIAQALDAPPRAEEVGRAARARVVGDWNFDNTWRQTAEVLRGL